jgi:hypothetical protein
LLTSAEVAGFACRSRALERLLAYWCRQRGARTMPRRGDIDPADIVELLPHIMMDEMDGTPPRARPASAFRAGCPPTARRAGSNT